MWLPPMENASPSPPKAKTLKFGDAGFYGGFGAFQDVAHFPGQAVGFIDAANFRIAITRAQKARELAVAVETFIVHLDDEDVIEAGENIFEARRQRTDVF